MDLNNALLQRFIPTFGGEIILVRISAVIDQLDSDQIEAYKGGHSTERAHQLACADQVVASVNGKGVKVERDDEGAPFLNGSSDQISISHTADFMAIYLHKSHRIAIDIEVKGRNIDAIKRRFALDEELNILNQAQTEEALLQLWSIKECLFKVIPVDQVLFKEHLFLRSAALNEGRWVQGCEVVHPKHHQDYSVVSRIFDPLIVSYTLIRMKD